MEFHFERKTFRAVRIEQKPCPILILNIKGMNLVPLCQLSLKNKSGKIGMTPKIKFSPASRRILAWRQADMATEEIASIWESEQTDDMDEYASIMCIAEEQELSGSSATFLFSQFPYSVFFFCSICP